MDVVRIHVTDREGNEYTLEGLDGWRVMEVIRDHGLPIKAECGGACSCATCHVYVDPVWADKLHEKSDEEIDMLDEAFDVNEHTSRLSCQILLNEDLEGLKVTLAPDGR
jgi:2Fe-2S ferredoxin